MSTADRLRQIQRHERLRELMCAKVEKMATKGLAHAALSDKQKEFIQHEVDLLIHSGDARESCLERIATSLKVFVEPPRKTQSALEVKTASAKLAVPTTSSKPAAPAEDKKKVAKPSSVSALDDHETSADRRRVVPPSVVHADDVWAELCHRDVEEYNCSLAAQRRVVKKKEEEQRQFLEAQVERRRQLRVAAHEEELRQAKLEEEQRKVFEAEEIKKKELVKQKLAAEKKLRDEQLAHALERKMREEVAKKLENEAQAKQAQVECAKETELQNAKRLKQKEEVLKFQEINKVFEEMKSQQRQKEADYDKEQQRLYLEKLAKQERDRDEALVKLFEKQKKQGQIASEMAASVLVKAAEDERKAQEYTAKKEAERLAALKRKQDKEEQEKMKVKQTLALQILEKEQVRLHQRDELLHQREEIKKEVQQAMQQERQRAAMEKMKKERQRALLEEQIDARSQSRIVHMSEDERKLNAKLIEKVLSPQRTH